MIPSYAGIPQPKVKEILTCSMGGSLKMQDMEGSQSQKDEQSMTQSHRHRCSDGAWAWHWPWEAGCHVQSVRTGQQLWRCSEDYTVYKHTML